MGGGKKMSIYSFSKEGSDGDASMKQLLGGKGANLAEMSKIGLSVPPGFTISTEVRLHFAPTQLCNTWGDFPLVSCYKNISLQSAPLLRRIFPEPSR